MYRCVCIDKYTGVQRVVRRIGVAVHVRPELKLPPTFQLLLLVMDILVIAGHPTLYHPIVPSPQKKRLPTRGRLQTTMLKHTFASVN